MTALEQKFEALLNELSQSLTSADVEGIQELIEANELGVALEDFCTQLFERDAVCSREQIDRIAEIGKATAINSEYWQNLRTA